MIGKCIAILAIVAQINANVCQQRTFLGSNFELPSQKVLLTESASPVASVAVQTPTISSVRSISSGSTSSSGAITKNIVAKGKYPVALTNCGPTPDKQIPVTTSHSTAPLQEKPIVRLPCKIPEPRTIAHSCTCYKTIVRPRVHNHIVTVPSVERYIETGHTPVIENIHYEAEPINCRDESDDKYYFVKAEGSRQLEITAPSRQVAQAVEIIAPTRQVAQAVEVIAPTRQVAQAVEVIAPIRQVAQAVEVIAPTRQVAPTFEIIAPAHQATQAVEFVSSAPALQVARPHCVDSLSY